MSSPSMIVPFYFAWVEPTDTAFDPVRHTVVEENIFSFDIQHDEGQVPTLNLTIQNPRVGLLSPGRKLWAWFSYQPATGGPVVPLFFGVLEGIPGDLFKELITLKFLARPHTYIEDKQAVAETLKQFPEFDPIFFDEAHRDDPDAILEGWSALYHVDRVTHAVTASDIITGEDGTITFAEGDAFYDSVSLRREQAPLTRLRIQATVNWTQRMIGYVDGPQVNISSYTGDTFLSEWPKTGTNLGSGWRVEASLMRDVYKVGLTPTAHSQIHWTNRDPTLSDCSTLSISQQSSGPALLSPDPITFTVRSYSKSGDCDPYDDPPRNTPTEVSAEGGIVPLWTLNGTWNLRYERQCEYSETIIIDMLANTQKVILSPTVEQNTEYMKINGANVGEPLVIVDAWSDIKNLFVPIATVIYPNDPTTPGGTSYQIAVQAGVAGSVEPQFSDIPGFTTVDGGVIWASLGGQTLNVQAQWGGAEETPLGKVINYQPVAFNKAAGDLLPTGQSTYYICMTPGITNSQFTEITYVPPVVSNDELTPAPQTFAYVAGPNFTTVPGQFIHDGTVVWMCLGAQPLEFGIPVGGTATNVTARCFFPSDRGQFAVKHLLCRGRARLRMRARAVKIGFECPFDAALHLSCRKNATIYDPRLPAGVATGKIISYGLHASGDGKLRGKVEIGCAVGRNGIIVASQGTPTYAAAGYMQPGYQTYQNQIIPLPSGDVGYTPPVFAPFDDGVRLPLVSLDGLAKGVVSGSIEEQKAAILAAIPEQVYLDNLENPQFLERNTDPSGAGTGTQVVSNILTPQQAWLDEQIKFDNVTRTLAYVMEAHPVSYEILLPPMQAGPFNGAYFISTTPLEIEMQIDLEAPSSP